MLTIRQVPSLIQQGDYVFSIDLKDGYLRIPAVKHDHYFLHFGNAILISGRFCHFGPATAPRVFVSLTKLILFLCQHSGFPVTMYVDDILDLTSSMHAGKRAQTFFLAVCCLGKHFFSSLIFISLSNFLFRSMLEYNGYVCIFAI